MVYFEVSSRFTICTHIACSIKFSILAMRVQGPSEKFLFPVFFSYSQNVILKDKIFRKNQKE